MSPEWGKDCNQRVRVRARAPQHPNLQPRDCPAASEAWTETSRALSASTAAAGVVSENGAGQPSTQRNRSSLQQASAPSPAHLSLQASGRLQTWEVGRNSKDLPRTGRRAKSLQTQFLPVGPDLPQGWRLGLRVPSP